MSRDMGRIAHVAPDQMRALAEAGEGRGIEPVALALRAVRGRISTSSRPCRRRGEGQRWSCRLALLRFEILDEPVRADVGPPQEHAVLGRDACADGHSHRAGCNRCRPNTPHSCPTDRGHNRNNSRRAHAGRRPSPSRSPPRAICVEPRARLPSTEPTSQLYGASRAESDRPARAGDGRCHAAPWRKATTGPLSSDRRRPSVRSYYAWSRRPRRWCNSAKCDRRARADLGRLRIEDRARLPGARRLGSELALLVRRRTCATTRMLIGSPSKPSNQMPPAIGAGRRSDAAHALRCPAARRGASFILGEQAEAHVAQPLGAAPA